MRPALLLVRAVHGGAIVTEADGADLIAHAISVPELSFFGHAVVGPIEAELEELLVCKDIKAKEIGGYL